MRTLQRVAIVVAAVGCLSTVGAGVSLADGGPEANAWAVSSSAAGATSRGGGYGGEQAAPQPAPQAAPQPMPQAPAPQAAPQPAPQPMPQPAPQAAPQPMQQGPAPQSEGRREDINVNQRTMCRSHDLNVDVLGQVGVLNGLLGNAINGEGDGGGQHTHQGSRMGCDNVALRK
ncbi:hypothetical protein [Streptomyces sp. CT34]|uniref:hypothetical protein n=1 Tax=Streptomyces sp. CT34 TaxID=1553907 RepID=UPI0005B8FDB0|nr:hypothetical protein [Streptomyces sp. CT34]